MADKKKPEITKWDNTSNPTKKLIVKNLKQKPILPDNYKKQALKKLCKSVIAIQTSTAIHYSMEELYQAVENMCNNNLAASLYNNLVELIESHAKTLLYSCTDVTNDKITFIKIVNNCWTSYCEQILLIRSIFLYLDRTYVLQNPSVKSIWDKSLNLFRQHIMLNKNVQNRAIDGLLLLIENERQGVAVDKTLLKSLFKMLLDLRLYHEIFEGKFVQSTDRLYANEGLRLILELDVPEYLYHVEKRLNEENERLIHYLDSSTKWPLIHTVEKQLISEHVNNILQMGLENLINEYRLEDLKLMFSLFSRVKKGLPELCVFFNAYIKKYGRIIVLNPDKDKTMVEDIISFKDKMDIIVKTCYQTNEKFLNSLKEAFENFINQRSEKPAELIAKYIDEVLKVGNKKSTEEELENLLDKIMVLFRYIHGKDIFEAFYKKHLAKRLLFEKSAIVDAEKSMLSKLKLECGGAFTSKLEGMFKDMEISKDLNVDYKKYLVNVKKDQLSAIDMTVNILTMGNWPTYEAMDVTMPNQIVQYQESFNEFYLNKYNGRKLRWQPNLGYCVLSCTFIKNKKELLINLFQAVILLLFNEYDKLNFKEIKKMTKIEDEELRRTLQSLACGKARVLVKNPKGRDIGDDDEFNVNFDFYNKLYRVKINPVQKKVIMEEKNKTIERVYQDRQCQIDAAIVRIMKMRKSLMHNLLISELFNQIKYPIKPTDLKIRIESLIDRDYIERDKDNPNQYNYNA